MSTSSLYFLLFFFFSFRFLTLMQKGKIVEAEHISSSLLTNILTLIADWRQNSTVRACSLHAETGRAARLHSVQNSSTPQVHCEYTRMPCFVTESAVKKHKGWTYCRAFSWWIFGKDTWNINLVYSPRGLMLLTVVENVLRCQKPRKWFGQTIEIQTVQS